MYAVHGSFVVFLGCNYWSECRRRAVACEPTKRRLVRSQGQPHISDL